MTRAALVVISVLLAAAPWGAARGAAPSSALDGAVSKLSDWNTPASDRKAMIAVLRDAGEGALGHVRALLKSKAWIARRDALTVASQIGASSFARMLTAGIRDRNWAVRGHAASLAADVGVNKRGQVEPVLKTLLKDRIARVRIAAYGTLAAWHPKADYIAGALADPDPEVSYWAARKYMQRARAGRIEGKARAMLVDSIISKLRSTHWQKIESMGLVTLLTLGGGAEDVLYEAIMEEPPTVRRTAISGIGSRAGKAGVGFMFRFVDDGDPSVRNSAIRSISSHSGRNHAPKLLQILESSTDSGTCQLMLQALGRLRYKKAVPRIAKMLTHHDDGVRRRALGALAELGDKSVAPKLIRMYRNEARGWRRSQLVSPIARLLRKDATAFLREAIRDEERAVRNYALYAARSYLSDKDKLEILMKVITDEEDDNVRQTAISSLGERDAAKATGVLARIVKDGGARSRLAAATALGRAKSPRAIKALMGAYPAEEDPGVSAAIITSLGRAGDKRAVPLLRKALTSAEPRTRGAAFNALARFPGVITSDFLVRFVAKEDDERVLKDCVSYMATRGIRDVRLLRRMAELMDAVDNSLRSAAVRFIANIDTVRATALLCKAIKEDSHPSVRSTAVNALVSRLSARKVPARRIAKSLGEALQTTHTDSRRRIVSALADLEERGLAPLLLRTLKTDASPVVRRAAALGLKRVADKEMVPQLIEAAKAEDRPGTLVVLIDVLGSLGDRRALPSFKRWLRAPEPSVQAAAMRAIGSFKDASLIPFYVERFKQSTSTEVRLTSLRNITGSGDRRALDVLMRALNDEGPQIRQAAVEALVEFCDAEVARALAAKLADGSTDGARAALVSGLLAKVRLRTVADQLLGAARKTKDEASLRSLYDALGKMRETRAAAPLADAVKARQSDELVRTALRALASLGAREHARVCLEAARGSFGRLSRTAASAAAKLSSAADVVDLLTERFRDGPGYDKRFYGALLAEAGGEQGAGVVWSALAETRDESVFASLCPVLPRSSPQSRQVVRRIALSDLGSSAAIAAVNCLGGIGDREAERALERIVGSSRPAAVRAAALVQLVTLRVAQWNRRADKVPGLLGPVLGHIASPEPELKLSAVRAAALLPGAAADGRIAQALTALVAARKEDAALRKAAVKALGAMRGNKAAEAALLKVLDDSDPAAPVAEAARSLGALRSAAAVKGLAGLARSGRLSTRLVAVEALGDIATKPAMRAVQKAFEQRDVDRLRAAAALALGRSTKRSYAPKLIEGLASAPGLDVRAACAEALGALGGRTGQAALLKAMADDSGMVRESAIRALGTMRAKAAVPHIRKLLADSDAGVAAAAKDVIAKLVSGRTK